MRLDVCECKSCVCMGVVCVCMAHAQQNPVEPGGAFEFTSRNRGMRADERDRKEYSLCRQNYSACVCVCYNEFQIVAVVPGVHAQFVRGGHMQICRIGQTPRL